MYDRLVVYAVGCYHTQQYIEPDQLNDNCLVCKNQMASHKHTRNKATAKNEMIESFRAMARVVREQAIATTFMAQHMANGNGNGNASGHGEEQLKFAEFCKANPPSFQGTYDSNATNEQIKEVEKIFSILTYVEE